MGKHPFRAVSKHCRHLGLSGRSLRIEAERFHKSVHTAQGIEHAVYPKLLGYSELETAHPKSSACHCKQITCWSVLVGLVVQLH